MNTSPQKLAREASKCCRRLVRLRVLTLWETAGREPSRTYHVRLDAVREPLLALIRGRIALVTDDESLKHAREGTAMLIDLMMHDAAKRDRGCRAEFFLNFALKNRRHLFPFTD